MMRITGIIVTQELLLRNLACPSIRPNHMVHPVEPKLDQKIDDTFLMASTSFTMQSLGKIVQCAPAVGAKMWRFLLFFLPAEYREAAKCRY